MEKLAKYNNNIIALVLRFQGLEREFINSVEYKKIRNKIIKLLVSEGFTVEEMGIALNSELIKEPYIHKNMTIEGWENKMKELEIRQSQVKILRKMYSKLSQISYMTNTHGHWAIWDEAWSGVETQAIKGNKMKEHLISYSAIVSRELDNLIMRWQNTTGKPISKAIEDLNNTFLSIRQVYVNMIKNLVSIQQSEYLDPNRPSMARNELSTVISALEFNNINASNILNHSAENIMKLHDDFKNLNYQPDYKGYTILDENGPLISYITKVLKDKAYNTEMAQILIEKFAVRYSEMVFKENSHDSIGEKVVSKGYQFIEGKINNEIVDKFKNNNYSSIVNKLAPSGDNRVLFGKTDIEMKALIVITLGVNLVVSETMMVAREMFTRWIDSGSITHTDIASKLGKRVQSLVNRIKVSEQPENWPYKTLHNNFTVNNAVELLKNNHVPFFTAFGSELVTLLCHSKLFCEEIVTVNNKSERHIFVTTEGMHNITLATSNPIDLPMICNPNKMDSQGEYMPYFTDIANQYHNVYHSSVRHKEAILYQSVNTHLLAETINSLNKQKFIIRKDVLGFLLKEWNEMSVANNIFKGYNKLYDGDTNTLQQRIAQRAHNSIHYQYKITLSIAELYKDHVFYLPVTSDFRGRIYVICNNLSYQSGDLSRALIGFYNDSEHLTWNGITEIAHYAGNVSGYDKTNRESRVSIGFENIKAIGVIVRNNN